MEPLIYCALSKVRPPPACSKLPRAPSYVDVAFSNACSGNPNISADSNSVNSGGVFCWDFASAVAPTYGGTLYTDEGITNAGSGKTVALSINGAAAQTDATDASGVWSITLSSAPAVGNTITAFVDGDESFKAVTISNASTTDEKKSL